MTYPAPIAAALTGASVRQLAYWRSSRSGEAPLLAPRFHRPGSRVAYSFRDVIALRTFVYLRARNVPLQRVRKAVQSLRELGENDHLSAYRLVALGKDVVWRASDHVAVDLTGQPTQQVIAEMADILSTFRARDGRAVLPLRHPVAGVEVDPEIRGGYPVLEGTRVPFDVVASLAIDGMDPAEITRIFPSVDPAAVRGAAEFARHVAGQRGVAAA